MELPLLPPSPDAPGVGSLQPTLSNTVDEPQPFRSLEVLAAGTVAFVCANGMEDTRDVQEGWVPYLIPVAMKRVKVTGTDIDASDLRGIL